MSVELTLKSLLEDIIYRIEKANKTADSGSIPTSENIYPVLVKKYTLDISRMPDLFDLLEKTHYIFCFDIVKEDSENNIPGVKGHILCDLGVIKTLVGYFEKQLMRLYTEVLNENLPVGKIKKHFPSIAHEHNNTQLGRVGNIVVNLNKFEEVLSRDYACTSDAQRYSQDWKEKRLKKEIKLSKPVSSYILTANEAIPVQQTDRDGPDKPAAKMKDGAGKMDSSKISAEVSLDKSLTIYGVEMYTRICFRDYKFSQIQKVIDDNLVRNRDDFIVIKNQLKILRRNSDIDLELQRYASDINRLEKAVNDRLK